MPEEGKWKSSRNAYIFTHDCSEAQNRIFKEYYIKQKGTVFVAPYIPRTLSGKFLQNGMFLEIVIENEEHEKKVKEEHAILVESNYHWTYADGNAPTGI